MTTIAREARDDSTYCAHTRLDSVHIRETIVLGQVGNDPRRTNLLDDQGQSPDTLFVEREIYRERVRVDTVYRETHDSIPVVVRELVNVPYVPAFYRYCTVFAIATVLIILFAIFGYLWLRPYRL